MATYIKVVNTAKLEKEISASSVSSLLVSLMLDGADALTINMSRALDPTEQAILDALVSAHSAGPTTLESCVAIVDNAMTFGVGLIRDFAGENVSLGITQRGLTSHVRKTLVEVGACLVSGSLYDAISELRVVDPNALDANVMTAARLLVFRNKIETYLNINPKATTWNQ